MAVRNEKTVAEEMREAKTPWLLSARGIAVATLAVILATTLAAWMGWNNFAGAGDDRVSKWRLADIPVDGKSAHERLVAICQLGPRLSGSDAMLAQRKMLTEHFEGLGAKVVLQEFSGRHPVTGEQTPMANMIVQFHPDRKERLLVCCHYDTRPYADEDPDPKKANTLGLFQGANDAAGSVAIMMEMGKSIPTIQTKYGVDFVFFDAEEFIFGRGRGRFFVGSEHFASQYVTQPPPYVYKKGVLLDMVSGKNLRIFREKNSNRWGRAINDEYWAIARRLQMSEFIDQTRHKVDDDHVPLNEIAKIPCIDVIDFDYRDDQRRGLWHTVRDTPENCSPLSMAKVGWVTLEWLKTAK